MILETTEVHLVKQISLRRRCRRLSWGREDLQGGLLYKSLQNSSLCLPCSCCCFVCNSCLTFLTPTGLLSVHETFQQESWSRLPFPSPGDLPDPGIKPTPLMSPELEAGSLALAPLGKPQIFRFSLVAQSCLTLCDPMNRSTPGLPVHHQLPEFTQTLVHREDLRVHAQRPCDGNALLLAAR